MIRGSVLVVSFLMAVAVPALAQTHSQAHGHTKAHAQAGHVPPDHANHAAMLEHHAAIHALMTGTWEGTFSSPHNVSSSLRMTVAHDSGLVVVLKLGEDQPLRAGAASNFMMNEGKLQWTQNLSGAACKATAVLSAATDDAPATLAGNMLCEQGEIEFTLHKKAK